MTIPKKASLSLLVGPLSLFLCVVTAVGQQRIVALDMPAYPQVRSQCTHPGDCHNRD
jgi:hypothetical protein